MYFLTVYRSQESECDLAECLCLKVDADILSSSHWPVRAMVTAKHSRGGGAINPLTSPSYSCWQAQSLDTWAPSRTATPQGTTFGEQIQQSVREHPKWKPVSLQPNLRSGNCKKSNSFVFALVLVTAIVLLNLFCCSIIKSDHLFPLNLYIEW